MSLEWSNSSLFKNCELSNIWGQKRRFPDATGRPSVSLNGLKLLWPAPRRGGPQLVHPNFKFNLKNYNFNSNTHKLYMILKALNVLYKIVSGTLSLNSVWFRRYWTLNSFFFFYKSRILCHSTVYMPTLQFHISKLKLS